MTDRQSASEILGMVAPALVVVCLLAAAPLWRTSLAPSPATAFWPLPLLALLATLATLYVPAGRWSLGLGAAALPVAIVFFGPALAAGVAAGALLLRQVVRRFGAREPLRHQGPFTLLPTGSDFGRVALAVLAAALVWRVGGGEPVAGGWGRALSGVAVYLAVLGGLRLLDLRLGDRGLTPADLAVSLALDLAGWLVGLALLRVTLAIGWPVPLLLLGAVALLAGEAARNVHLRRKAVARVRELWKVTQAGHRIIYRNPGLTGLAEQVLAECRNVLPFSWFQFELPAEPEGPKSWFAGPDGRVQEGIPEPAETPPMLPGIHRRTAWKILGRELTGDGQAIARLRFWCDPRKLEPTSVELFDSLLPQIAASVHRALLERQVKLDALTGLADRRVLETRLEQVFLDTREGGGTMAVIMCDLDRFKRINDRYGHGVGDQALMQVAAVLETHRRETDLCCRYGGEEFAVILEETDGVTAQRVAERLRLELERSVFLAEGRRVPLRMSAGVAAFPELHVKEGRELLLLADEALYKAKRRGRNQSLLNLGRNRYRAGDGKLVEPAQAEPVPEPPTLFA